MQSYVVESRGIENKHLMFSILAYELKTFISVLYAAVHAS